MSQIRMQNHFGAVRAEERYSVDGDLLREIRQVRLLKFYFYGQDILNVYVYANYGSVLSVCLQMCVWSAVSPSVVLSVFVCVVGQYCLLSVSPFSSPQHLKQQQEGLSQLISVIKDDVEDIKLIEHGLLDRLG